MKAERIAALRRMVLQHKANHATARAVELTECLNAIESRDKEVKRLQAIAWYIWEGEGRGGFSDPEACKLIGVSSPDWAECLKAANTEGQDNEQT